MFFRILGSQKSNASNDTWIGAETKKLWLFEDNYTKLSEMLCENFAGCFVAAKPPLGTRVPFRRSTPSFHSCEMGCEMAYENVPWLRNGLQAMNQVANHLQVTESPPSCEITNSTCKMDNSNLRNPPVQTQIFAIDLVIFFFSRYFLLVISQRYYWDIS